MTMAFDTRAHLEDQDDPEVFIYVIRSPRGQITEVITSEYDDGLGNWIALDGSKIEVY